VLCSDRLPVPSLHEVVPSRAQLGASQGLKNKKEASLLYVICYMLYVIYYIPPVGFLRATAVVYLEHERERAWSPHGLSHFSCR
jgi:hypothetical protein